MVSKQVTRPKTTHLADELDLVPLDVPNDQDLQLCQEVKGQVGDGIPLNRLLDQEDVATALLDGLAQLQKVLPLFPQDPVHLGVI